MYFLESKTYNFGWAIFCKGQITELMLTFIPTITGSYSDRIFSIRISFIRWFKYRISSRWDCLIIVNIRAEDEPTFKDRGKKVVK